METLLSISIAVMITLGCGLLLLFLFMKLLNILFNHLFGPEKTEKKSGVEAVADILGIERIGMPGKNGTRVRIQIQVRPDKGRNFVSEIDVLLSVEELSAVKPGSIVKVHYNPRNYRQLSLEPFTKQQLPLAG